MPTSISENIKKFFINSFAGAVGALITLLIISQWQQMAENAAKAKESVDVLRSETDERLKSFEARFAVLINRQAKTETQTQVEAVPVPLIVPDDKLKKYEEKKEQIQKEIDKEIFRTGQRN